MRATSALRALVFVAIGAPAFAAPAGGLVLVVGQSSPITNISKADLAHVFSADPIRVAGNVVVPFSMPPASPERQAFDLAVLGMAPDEVNRFWIDRRIRGQGSPPKSAPSAEVVAKVVAKFPGAIGYVPIAALNPGLRPVAVDGRAYTDAGYLLGAR
jgi:hypothetical protein